MSALFNPALINIFWLFLLAATGIAISQSIKHREAISATYSNLSVRTKIVLEVVGAGIILALLMNYYWR